LSVTLNHSEYLFQRSAGCVVPLALDRLESGLTGQLIRHALYLRHWAAWAVGNMPGARMTRVLISHATGDRQLGEEGLPGRSDAGHEVFLDQDPGTGITVGEDWERRLLERLRWADAVLCVVTAAYLASAWCSAEVGIARSRGSRLLPVRAEPG